MKRKTETSVVGKFLTKYLKNEKNENQVFDSKPGIKNIFEC